MIQASSSRVGKLASIVLLIAVGFGCAALALELGVRLLIPVSDFFWQSDPVLGVKLRANKHGRFVRAGLFDVQVATNSQGFRDRERAHEKPHGVKRVVILGDSYMEALQVPYEKSVSALLEKRLGDKSVPAETINLGVSAYGTGREYLMLREHGLKYRPDVVLLFFVGNDLINNSQKLEGTPYVPYPLLDGNEQLARDERGEPRFTPIVDAEPNFAYLAEFLREHSKSYAFLRATIEQARRIHGLLFQIGIMTTPPASGGHGETNLGLFEVYKTEESDALRQSWTLTENLLIEIKRLAERHGAQFELVLIPAPWEVYPQLWEKLLDGVPAMSRFKLDLAKPSRRLTSFLKSREIAYVDLLPSFRAQAKNSPALFFESDHHWTAAGHHLATELIVDSVVSMLKSSVVSNP